MDKKGYVMGGMAFLLVLPAILLLMVFIDMTNSGIAENSRVLKSTRVLSTVNDLENNLPVTAKQVFQNEAENVVNSGIPLSNSRETIKRDLQTRMDQIARDYEKNDAVEVECNITSVGNSEDPFAVEVNSSIYVGKDDVTHQEYISQDVSLIDPQYPIMNPLPFIKCKNHGGAQSVNGKIIFGTSLVNYLESRGVENASAYENSTTALIIKKCPYDPYKMHGNDFNTLKNCIDNGYFHESSDGSCFLCRLEGKGTCPHYGFETFIVPSPSSNITYNGTNFTLNSAPSSIDHVIFNETNQEATYHGKQFIYYSDGINLLFIYLDNAHRQKYGLPII